MCHVTVEVLASDECDRLTLLTHPKSNYNLTHAYKSLSFENMKLQYIYNIIGGIVLNTKVYEFYYNVCISI